jgi:flagellar basal-body rod protein FlgF
MDNALYVGLSRQMTLQRQLDLAANNLANVDTAGFKVESLMLQSDPLTPQRAPRFGPVKYVLDDGLARDFKQGALEKTGNTYDLAVEGDGFFQVQTPDGVRYTRDGRFHVDTSNQLVDAGGNPVLDASGSPISFDPQRPAPVISKTGLISQGDQAGAKVGVVRFASKGGLSKQGDNYMASGESPTAAPDGVVRQGMVEHSNVSPVTEVTSLIDITRAYERVANMMNSTQDLSRDAIQRLGKAA